MTAKAPPPSLSCPALLGNGAGIGSAEFTFVVTERSSDQYGHLPVTEAFGYFTLPGSEPGDDVLQTGSFETPAGSPIGWAARHAAAHPGVQAQIAAILRGNVGRCPCTAPDGCAALSARHLLLALCRVTRRSADNPVTPGPGSCDQRGDGHRLTAGCPLECLATFLSARAYNPLRRELPGLLQRPPTVADVARMCQRRQLRYVPGLGPHRINEIELTLLLADLSPAPGPVTTR